MQQQTIDLGYVMGNTLATLSWTGFTLVCALAVIGIACCLLPFAVFGVKRRLDAIESAQRHQTELLTTELRRTNEILVRRVGSVSAQTEAADPWQAAPAQSAYAQSGYAEPPRAVASAPVRAMPAPEQAPAALAPVLVQATQPAEHYAPYPDDPRPAPPQPRRDVRWTRFARQGTGGSAA